MDFLTLPFESDALNASFIALCILMLPFPIIVYTVISTRFLSKKDLLFFGFILIFLSVLLTPLFTGLIEVISEYEHKQEKCQNEYIYKKLSGQEPLPECDELKPSQQKDLSIFKSFTIVSSVTVTIIILSLGVSLLASAISMSQERLAIEELYNKIDEIKDAVDRQSRVLRRFFIAIILLLIITIVLVIFANG